MLDFPFETVVHMLAALPHVEIACSVVRVCREWHALHASEPFSVARAAVDERGLVVARGDDCWSRRCRLLIGGRWFERASMPYDFRGVSIMFCGELVLIGNKRDESDGEWSPCCLAFNLKASAWRTLEWEGVKNMRDCCTTGAVVVALSCRYDDRMMLRSLRPGSAEGWDPLLTSRPSSTLLAEQMRAAS